VGGPILVENIARNEKKIDVSFVNEAEDLLEPCKLIWRSIDPPDPCP
jgi:hypothetical protein